MYYSGGCVGFYSGDIKELTNDLKALRPTVMPAVPRLLNRVYDKIHAEVSNSAVKRMLFNMALKSKEAEMKRGIIRRNTIWDKIVFRKVQDGECGELPTIFRTKLLNWTIFCFSVRRKSSIDGCWISTAGTILLMNELYFQIN